MANKKKSAFEKIIKPPTPAYHTNLRMDYLKDFAVGEVFVETGTNRGDGILLAQDFGFKYIHSAELDKALFRAAHTKFRPFFPNIKIHHGSSPDCLETIIYDHTMNNREATFWLDAHDGAGQTPLWQELQVIAQHPIKTHTIFIDDRRLFESGAFGSLTEGAVLDKIKQMNPNYSIINLDGYVHSDIICAFVRKGKK